MRTRPVRSQIYLPVVKWGVSHTDWKYVGIISALAYIIPFIFDLKIKGIPLPLWTGLIGLAASIGFFNYVRVGRPPHWLQHTVSTLLEDVIYRGPDYLRTNHRYEQKRSRRFIVTE